MPSLVGSGLAERPSRVERRPSLLEGYGKSSKAAGRVGSAHGPETHRAESPKLLAVFRRLRLGGGRQSPRRDGCAREALLQLPLQRSRNGFRDRREQPHRGRTSGEGSAQRPALGWLHGPYGLTAGEVRRQFAISSIGCDGTRVTPLRRGSRPCAPIRQDRLCIGAVARRYSHSATFGMVFAGATVDHSVVSVLGCGPGNCQTGGAGTAPGAVNSDGKAQGGSFSRTGRVHR
jgi:hypothetical protein